MCASPAHSRHHPPAWQGAVPTRNDEMPTSIAHVAQAAVGTGASSLLRRHLTSPPQPETFNPNAHQCPAQPETIQLRQPTATRTNVVLVAQRLEHPERAGGQPGAACAAHHQLAGPGRLEPQGVWNGSKREVSAQGQGSKGKGYGSVSSWKVTSDAALAAHVAHPGHGPPHDARPTQAQAPTLSSVCLLNHKLTCNTASLAPALPAMPPLT